MANKYTDWATLDQRHAESIADQRVLEEGRAAFPEVGSLPEAAQRDAALAEFLGKGVNYPVLAGEVGVVNKQYPYGDVRRFGAVGDYDPVSDTGTDNTTAFNNWLASVLTVADAAARNVDRGAKLRLPAGNYLLLTEPNAMVRGTIIEGDGSECTHVTQGFANGDVFHYTTPGVLSVLPTVGLSGVTIDMRAGVVAASGAGVNFDGTLYQLRVELDDVYVFSTFNGVKLTNVQGGHMRRTQAAYTIGDGFIQNGFASLFHIDSSWMAACGGRGWFFNSLLYCDVVGCGADGNLGGGWEIDSTHGSTFTIGAELNYGTSIKFATVRGSKLACRIVGNANTVDGLWIGGATGFECTPAIDTSASSTGFPLKITGTTNKGIVVHAADIGTYSAGTKRVTGADQIAYWDDNGQVQVGGSQVVTNAPQYPWGVNFVSGVVGIARKVMAEIRHRPSDNAGSAVVRLTGDGSNSFAELEHNSLVSGPFTYGTFGDVIIRASAATGRVLAVCNATIAAIFSAAGDLTTRRIFSNGTAHVAGDYALSAGWGTTAVIAGGLSARDSGGRVVVTSSGTGQAANPTIALTFKNGTWTSVPRAVATRGDVNAPTTAYWALTSITATVATWAFVGTPVSGTSYTLDFLVMG